MAKGYWIARVDVSDMEAYQQYVQANAAPFADSMRVFSCVAVNTKYLRGQHVHEM